MSIIQIVRLLITKISPGKVEKYSRRDGVSIGKNCSFLGMPEWGSEPYLIKIGDNVRVTRGVKFITHDGGMYVLRNGWPGCEGIPNADKFGSISIGNNVFIGMNAVIMPGVTIGNNVVIGTGSIVTKNIPDNSVACGVPAKVIETIEEYREKSLPGIVLTNGMTDDEKKRFLMNLSEKGEI